MLYAEMRSDHDALMKFIMHSYHEWKTQQPSVFNTTNTGQPIAQAVAESVSATNAELWQVYAQPQSPPDYQPSFPDMPPDKIPF